LTAPFPNFGPTHPTPTPAHRWCAVGLALLVPSLVTWVYFVLLAGDPSRAQQLAFAVGKGIQFAWPLGWVWIFDRQRMRRGPVTQRGIGLGLGLGLLISLVMLSLYFLALRPGGYFAAANHQILDKVRDFGISTPTAYFALGAFYSVCHAGLEEYYWRWFVFGQLRAVTSEARATVLSSLGFMAHHVILLVVYFGSDAPLTYLFSLCVAVGGALWAGLYQRTGSLLGPWLSHMCVDAAIFVVGYDIVRPLFQ